MPVEALREDLGSIVYERFDKMSIMTSTLGEERQVKAT